MATHSSVLAWRIPVMAEPGGLPSVALRLKRLSRREWESTFFIASDLAGGNGSLHFLLPSSRRFFVLQTEKYCAGYPLLGESPKPDT